MKGDFSRRTAGNAAARHYSGVLMQQGRLHTDADWNEQVEITLARSETALGDIVGDTGTPKGENGFRISAGAGSFRIGAGRYYLDGALLQNDEDVSYEAQGGEVGVPPLSEIGGNGTPVIVYLEATRRHVNGLEDPHLLDPALNSVDTATRIMAAWRVGVEAVNLSDAEREALIDEARCGHATDLPGWSASTGGMSAQTLPAGTLPDDSDCKIPPEAGYLSQENQLYRVEIISGGTRSQSRFVWSRENGSVEAVLVRNPDGDFILQDARDDEALGFKTGDLVEVYDAADSFNSRGGALRRIALTDQVVTFSSSIGDFAQMIQPRVRRWDQAGTSTQGRTLSTSPVELERGIEVSFSNGTYRAGDYWVFEARAATGNIVWPQYPMEDPTEPVPPMGWGFRRAALALATIQGGALVGITDLRAEFPSLTCLQAEDVGFDDSHCQMGAETVQEALDILCRRTSAGLCTYVAGSAAELVSVAQSLKPDQSVRICLRAGNFSLAEAVRFEGLGHVILQGTGPQTVIGVANTEPALLFRGCASVRVTDLSLGGGPTGNQGRFRQDGRLGALTAIDCGDVAVERVRARCRAGLDRSTACISTLNNPGSARHPAASVLIRDCNLKVGQSQIGMQVIGARRSIIENNLITPVRVGGDIVRRRVLADPVLVARMRRSILDFPGARSLPGNVNVGVRPEPLDGLFSDRVAATLGSERVQVNVRADSGVATLLNRALARNSRNRISDEQELRQHAINVVEQAMRDPRGRAFIGGRRIPVLDTNRFTVLQAPFLAQGIVVAGAEVEDAHILGNRIEGANDGIRVAASSRSDPLPPGWNRERPDNTVVRVRIEGNVIAVSPVASTTDAHGVFLGHVDNATVGQNDISGGAAPNGKLPRPHFGVYQYGYRGPRLTVTENTVTNLFHGFAIIPEISDALTGIWRLRDNATPGCARPTVLASGVQVI
ncbi:MAG: DUF6519 domain-containing protein [Halieaceae bacterium]|jgi:hypothetical protein|nr:DUF6519 domain-containing protein [Halieaceae bacterium]